MSDAIRTLHDYLAKSPSVIYPEDVLAYLPAIEDENARLRKLVVLWSVINKHMSLCATTDCGQCPVREECEESVYLEGLLGIDPKKLSWRVQKRMAEATDVQADNAKLRELLKAAYRCTNAGPSCLECRMVAGGCTLLSAMRELGVEA